MGVGAAGLLALAFWRGGLGAVAAFGPAQWVAVAYMALIATPVALWLWIFALNRATPTRVASTMAMHPISASILAALIIGEPIGLNLARRRDRGARRHLDRGERSPGRPAMSERLGVLIAVLSSTFGGMAAAVTRYVVGTIDPVTIGAFRFGIGVAVLLPLALMLRSALPRGRDWIGAGAARHPVLRGVLRVLQHRAWVTRRPRAGRSRSRPCRSGPWWSRHCSAPSR